MLALAPGLGVAAKGGKDKPRKNDPAPVTTVVEDPAEPTDDTAPRGDTRSKGDKRSNGDTTSEDAVTTVTAAEAPITVVAPEPSRRLPRSM